MFPDYITIHHSCTLDGRTFSWAAIRKNHKKKGWSDIGYHYGVELVQDRYEVMTGRMMPETGAHCIQRDMNRRAIGVCLIGNFDNHTVPKIQWELAIDLVSSLCYLLDIPRKNVLGHREAHLERTCPGRYFDMNQFRKDLRGKSWG
jgi:N-acetylmuramoyl-L-alanine amidase